MAEQEHSQAFHLMECDARVRNVLRKLRIDTVEKFLSLTEAQLSQLKNCSTETITRIQNLQHDYRKYYLSEKNQEYMCRLIVVAMTARELLEGAEKFGPYYFRVNRQRIGLLKEALEELKNCRQVNE